MLKSGVVTALGTMSGTSLDGVDAAVIETDGEVIHAMGPSSYRPYSEEERQVLRAHLGRWQTDNVSAAKDIVEAAHIDVVRSFNSIDIAGFHGQTLAHDPRGRGTHQCGDGTRLAKALDRPVVWDFRSADVAAGGQGAPLAPFYHFALAKWLDAKRPFALLNLGGVGNVTLVDPTKSRPEDNGALLAFDTGPANAPINDLMLERRGVLFDRGGALAAEGTADKDVVRAFLAHSYFGHPPPKSLDRDDFSNLLTAVSDLSDDDAAATLAAVAVASVVKGLSDSAFVPDRLLVTGGGRHNTSIMSGLSMALSCDVNPIEDVGLNGDMLEAQAFAYLAVRSARGMPISAPGTTGIGRPSSGGLLSLPN